MSTLVFDTGPLSHFARAEWLEVLRAVIGERRAVIPDAVVTELQRGAQEDHRLRAVLNADWIEQRELRTEPELRAFAGFASRLVSGQRNIGEAAVLALAETIPAQAVVDDNAAHKAAQRAGVSCTRTLALLCEAIGNDLLTIDLVSEIADDLITTEYRLPFKPGDFANWAIENGLVAPRSRIADIMGP